MSLSHLTINETAGIDTWNQERSPEHLQGLIGRLSEKAFAVHDDEFEFDF